jgi:glycosyltransferase involved in cell wall biosynthesis
MRVLVLSALFPPNVIGGAEMSAYNLAAWMGDHGCEVAVLTSCAAGQEEVHGERVSNYRLWRLRTPHIYPVRSFPSAPSVLKPIWHAQDHFDPRNALRLGDIIDEYKPDIVNIHYLQGLGYNLLDLLAERGSAVMYYLHDIGLSCVRMSMYRRGANCITQCGMCRFSTDIKRRKIDKIARIGLCSPSLANLERVVSLLDRPNIKRRVVPNANRYPAPTNTRTESDIVRFLYVGRIHPQKGIDVIIDAAERLARQRRFSLTIVGGGPDESRLTARCELMTWCKFTGNVPQQEVSNLMNSHDLLLLPSVWLENSPGVAIQALGIGLPVIGSNIGGIPELVDKGVNGALVEPGNVSAWTTAMCDIIDTPDMLKLWRANARNRVPEFSQDYLGTKVISFMKEIIESDGRRI